MISKRNLVKSLIEKWRANFYCFLETKLEKDVDNGYYGQATMGMQMMRWVYVEAEGGSSAILML